MNRTPLQVRAKIAEWMNDPLAPSSMNQGANNSNMGHVQKAIPTITAQESRDRGIDKGYNRHLVFGYIFGDPSQPFRPIRSGELSDGQWFALSRWVDANKGNDGKYRPAQGFRREAKWVWNFADYCATRTEEQPELLFGDLLKEDDENNWPTDDADLDESLVEQARLIGHEMIGDQSKVTNTGQWDGKEPIRLDVPRRSDGTPITDEPKPEPEKKRKPLSEQMLIPDEWL